MAKKMLISMDVEPDISRYLKDSYVGIEKGLPVFMDLLSDFGFRGDFFVTGEVCRKYPKIIEGIAKRGLGVGNHGYDHSIDFYCKMDFEAQLADILRSTDQLKKVTGVKPRMFRTPNFSANGDTIKALERLGYTLDSSILPGRQLKKWKLLSIYDFTKAPRSPYHPTHKDITKRGTSSILEVPLTENPHLKGAPIGMGYLNYAGLKKTISAVESVKAEYVTFLAHPWELVDMKEFHPDLPQWVCNICSSGFEPLKELLEYIDKNMEFASLEDIQKGDL